MPGMEKIFSTTRLPVIRPTISGASTVTMGIRAFLSTWRKMSLGPYTPLLSASNM